MAEGNRTRLAAELELYALHRQQWLEQHPRQYVVIKGNTILDFYATFQDAYRAGAGTWGVDTDFLVKQIVEHEPVFFLF